MSDFVLTLKAGVVLAFVLFFAAGGLTLTVGPTGHLLIDLLLWMMLLAGGLYTLARLAKFLRRRRFGDEPPQNPLTAGDLMLYSACLLSGPLVLAMFGRDATHPGKDRNFAIGAVVVAALFILSPLVVVYRYVTRR